MVRLPEFRSPLARAVLPVVGGLIVLALIGSFTWGMAAVISSGGAESSERLAPSTFTVGNVEFLSDLVESDGPLLFAELGTPVGARSIVIDHIGDDPALGWRVYWAYPADRGPECIVEQVLGTDRFIDCDGREITVDQLSPPGTGVRPVVYDSTRLEIDLRGVASD